ncbi:Uncharacterised protein [Segatella copri]|nr:Uncharacterised protein [Segatella copri]
MLLACFGIEISYTRIEIVGSHRMPHRLILLTERMAILIVIFTILHFITNGYQSLCQFQITLVTGSTVHL